MTSVPSGDELVRAKAAEHAWHDKFYSANARYVYPDSLEEFRKFFVRHHLTPFCDGGGSWWTDARREMVDAIGNVRGKRVLDYACGFGMLGVYLSSSGADVCGFDLSSSAVEVAKEAALKYGLPAKFEQMDATDLAYPNGHFDLVVGFGVIHHVDEISRRCRSASSCLKTQRQSGVSRDALGQSSLQFHPQIHYGEMPTRVTLHWENEKSDISFGILIT